VYFLSSDFLIAQDSATFFRRALHLVFARSVTGKQVADALAEKLKANLSPAIFNAFSQTLLNGTCLLVHSL